jgi:hypothetical protein
MTGVLIALAAAPLESAQAAPAPLPGSDDCLMCHQAGPPLERREAGQAPRFDEQGLRDSPHATLECVACHADLKGKDFPHGVPLAPVDCGSCHTGEASQYSASVHGAEAARGDPSAPTCKRCHGTHAIRRVSDARSPAYVRNVPALCGSCHRPGVPRPSTPAGTRTSIPSTAPASS